MYDVGEKFIGKLLHCPNHQVSENMLVKIFYQALDPLNKNVVDNVAGGSLVKLTQYVDSNLLDEVT